MKYETESLPLLSIMIATRNRIPYVISAIQSILEIPDPRLELVVQDNSDSRELETYVHANIHDSRFRYRYTPPPFSMIDNFNAVVELATGEYLCLIGDDDGVNPEIMEAAEWAKSENLDSLAVKCRVNYFWPGTGIPDTLFTKVNDGCLQISQFDGYLIDVEIEKEMRNLAHDGGGNYLNFRLPKLYHGFVHRRCLEAVYQKTGVYFGGLSPDIFASLSVACVALRVMVTDYPLTIPGVCPGSGSTYTHTGGFGRRLEDTFLWRDRGEYDWCELVPRVYTAQSVWADSGVAALRAMGREDLVREINLVKLAAYCIIEANHRAAWPVLRDMFRGLKLMQKSRIIGAFRFTWSLVTVPGLKFARRAWNRLLVILRMRTIRCINGLENMVEVSHALAHYLRENGYRFSDCARRRTDPH